MWWSCNYAVTNGQTEVTIDEPQREPRAARIGAIRRRVRKGAKTNERKPPKGRS